jgi:hypothetical protein
VSTRKRATRATNRRPKGTIKTIIRGRKGIRPAFEVDEQTECWNSTAQDMGNGYRVGPGGGTAHRRAYEDFYGELPDCHEVHHLCGNRACVNARRHLVALPCEDHDKLHAYQRAAARRTQPNTVRRRRVSPVSAPRRRK